MSGKGALVCVIPISVWSAGTLAGSSVGGPGQEWVEMGQKSRERAPGVRARAGAAFPGGPRRGGFEVGGAAGSSPRLRAALLKQKSSPATHFTFS